MSTTTDLMTRTIDSAALARLREKAAQQAELQPWRPRPGEVLEGQIIGWGKVDGPFGSQPQAHILTPEGKRVTVWINTHALLTRLMTEKAAVGDLVRLVFHGKPHRGGLDHYDVTLLKPSEAEE